MSAPGTPAPAVSVVLPVYNAAELLPECLDALLGQTFEDFEVLAFEDGSTDDSGAVLDAYAARDARLRIIRQANMGQYPTRNKALLLVRGRYMLSVDCDDRPALNMIERLFHRAEAFGADIAIGGWDYLGNERRPPDVAQWNLQAFHEGRHGGTFPMGYGYMWMKLYRTDFLHRHGLRFREEFFSKADVVFHWSAMSLAERIVVVPQVLYHYRVHENSVTGRIGAKAVQTVAAMERIRQDLIELGDPRGLLEYWPAFAGDFLHGVLHQTRHAFREPMIEAMRAFAQRRDPEDRARLTGDPRLGPGARAVYRLLLDDAPTEAVLRRAFRGPSPVQRLRNALLPQALRAQLLAWVRRNSYWLSRDRVSALRASVQDLDRQLHELAVENHRLRGRVEASGPDADAPDRREASGAHR